MEARDGEEWVEEDARIACGEEVVESMDGHNRVEVAQARDDRPLRELAREHFPEAVEDTAGSEYPPDVARLGVAVAGVVVQQPLPPGE